MTVSGQLMTGPLPYDSDEDILAGGVLRNTSAFVLKFCRDRLWRAFKVGPFSTKGGYFWHHAAWYFRNESASSLLPTFKDNVYAFSDYFLGSLDALSSIIGYPPIHQHHFHFWGAHEVVGDKLNAHGDNQCVAEEGGKYCYVRSAPRGLAYVSEGPLTAFNDFNDVRYPSAPRMDSWMTVVVKIYEGTSEPRRISATFFAAWPRPWRSRGTYEIRTDMDSVVWYTSRLLKQGPFGDARDPYIINIPASESILEAYSHSHSEHLQDVWLFLGTAEQVFCNMSRVSPANVLDYSSGILHHTMSNIRARQLHGNAASLLCSHQRSARSEVVDISGVAQTLYRKARCALPADVHHQYLTLVVLHRNPVLWNGRPVVRMHAFYTVFFTSTFTRHGQYW